MDKNICIETLEALAEGCSPTTGELAANNEILNERIVIRALQFAIDELKDGNFNEEDPETEENTSNAVYIPGEEIDEIIKLLEEAERNVTVNTIVTILRGTRKFKNKKLVHNQYFGRYYSQFTKGQLVDYFTAELDARGYGASKKEKLKKIPPFREIEYFRVNIFNKLSEEQKLKALEKGKRFGVLKTENLSDGIIKSRENYPRAYETWSEEEKQFLANIIESTNDLKFLSECFQRGENSIESMGQRIIFEKTNK